MKPFFTFLLVMIFSAGINANCQSFASYVIERSSTLPSNDLESYRQSIWDNPPAAVSWINDFENLFTNEQEFSLDSMIRRFEKQTGIEIAIVTVDSNMVWRTKFNDFTERLLYAWGIGKKLKDNGIVICISSEYKRIKISGGTGIDQYLSPAEQQQFAERYFIPYYRKQNYYAGTFTGLHTLITKITERIGALY